ncbi:MAG TPA: hypothetical protein VFH45_01415 [Acidimicrobiales bacterium]|nr:hypothetical protein [Acidimicrobiales bacterium]
MPTHPDLSAEQAYIDRAYEALESMRESARRMLASVIGQGRGGTHQAREERDVIVRSSLQRLEQLDIGQQTLCFGRIDQAGDVAGQMDTAGDVAGQMDRAGDSDLPPDIFYIGRLGVSGPNLEPLVVDWRAPVAEPFYRATGAHPMGLLRRRHFLTEGPRLVAIEDDVFGEGELGEGSVGTALLSSMEQARTGRMRDIVATIQAEQDQIIRAPLPGVLVVQGGPGTGKTAVALHRAAYLLYTHRFPLERQGVLVVGPNQLFLRYIEQVLPSLGESGAVLSTLPGLVPEVRARATEPASLAALKGDARMARVLARAVRDRQRALPGDLEVAFGAYVLRITRQDTAEAVAAGRRRHGPHNARRRFVEQRLHQLLYERYAQLSGALGGPNGSGPETPPEVAAALDVEEDDLPAADGQLDEDEFRRRMRRHPVVVAALDRMWPRLLAEELVHDLFGSMPLLRSAGRGILSDREATSLHRRRSDRLGVIPWTPADVALLDEAKVLLGPVRTLPDGEPWPRTYGHIVVDEAQDLTAMQLRMLSRRSISGSMTVVGDVAQATGAEAPSGWESVLAHLSPRRPASVVELTVNYRTPSEVMDVASRVLAAADPGLVPPRSVRTAGVAPRAVRAGPSELAPRLADLATAELAAVSGGTVAIICPDSWAPRLAEGLTDAGLSFGVPEVDGLDSPVTLVPVGVVKGLEFDSVVVVEPAAILGEAAQGMRALYVALTRTTRRLTVVHGSPLPAELAGLGPRPG